jgi:hypothetical protein
MLPSRFFCRCSWQSSRHPCRRSPARRSGFRFALALASPPSPFCECVGDAQDQQDSSGVRFPEQRYTFPEVGKLIRRRDCSEMLLHHRAWRCIAVRVRGLLQGWHYDGERDGDDQERQPCESCVPHCSLVDCSSGRCRLYCPYWRNMRYGGAGLASSPFRSAQSG